MESHFHLSSVRKAEPVIDELEFGFRQISELANISELQVQYRHNKYPVDSVGQNHHEYFQQADCFEIEVSAALPSCTLLVYYWEIKQ